MTRNPQLIYALLAMDTYHRGANGGLNDFEESFKVPASAIDGWTLLETTPQRQSDATGFSATAYAKGGQTVISYRGTDQNRFNSRSR